MAITRPMSLSATPNLADGQSLELLAQREQGDEARELSVEQVLFEYRASLPGVLRLSSPPARAHAASQQRRVRVGVPTAAQLPSALRKELVRVAKRVVAELGFFMLSGFRCELFLD